MNQKEMFEFSGLSFHFMKFEKKKKNSQIEEFFKLAQKSVKA